MIIDLLFRPAHAIETAPRDGRELLVRNQNEIARVVWQDGWRYALGGRPQYIRFMPTGWHRVEEDR